MTVEMYKARLPAETENLNTMFNGAPQTLCRIMRQIMHQISEMIITPELHFSHGDCSEI